uniref:Uncharacterized protein n=1 Tax=Rhizophora mucronata TaxID=61149 RepID=A0A2P2KKF0_RHIMU
MLQISYFFKLVRIPTGLGV